MSASASSPAPAHAGFVRALAWLHRWTGVGLSLLFLMWFASGAVLSFVPFPALEDADILARSPIVAANQIAIAPAQALAAAGGGDSLALVGLPDRAVYVAGRDGAPLTAVDARTGARQSLLGRDQAGRIAARFGGAAVRRISGPFDYDQWVVHQGFDRWRPFYRVSLAGPDGRELYVSARTGQVVQGTLAAERAWNWAGAVIHWLYFTVLRKSFAAWDQTVWWVSLIGIATALAGIYLGVYRTAKRLEGRRPDWSPYRGWMRWHHGLGFAAAVFVLTWIVSGWLSMDHGRLFSRGEATQAAIARYQGRPLAQALAGAPASALTQLLPASRITFAVVGGRPIAAGEGGGRAPQTLRLDGGVLVQGGIPTGQLAAAVATAWPLASAEPKAPADAAFYSEAEELPPRAVSFALREPAGAYLYLDPLNGRVLTVLDRSRQAYAWAYYALHTFKFPALVDRPALRRGLEFIPLALGLGFSLTGLVISIRRLRLTAAR